MSTWPARVTCFFIEPNGRVRRSLRRYSTGGAKCRGPVSYHNARVPIDVVEDAGQPSGDLWPHDDARWPASCDACAYQFTGPDVWMLDLDREYVRRDTGDVATLRTFGPGAMWFADWMLAEGSDRWRGPDGHCLAVKLPNGIDWVIDSYANNCDAPCLECGQPFSRHLNGEIPCRSLNPRAHKCWVRHGTVPRITVDKHGDTCHAGAGSIGAGRGERYYHGFLRNGELVLA